LKTPQDLDVFSFDIETPNGKKTIALSNPSVPEVNAIRLELEKFVEAILFNTPPSYLKSMGSGLWISPIKSCKKSNIIRSIPDLVYVGSKKPHTIPILWYILSDYIAALLSSNIFHFSRASCSLNLFSSTTTCC